jgi:hypothetical protein
MRSKSGWQDIHLEWPTKEIPAVFRQFRLDAMGGWINGIRQDRSRTRELFEFRDGVF